MIDKHRDDIEPMSEAMRELYRERMYAFCFPNVPRTQEEQTAFDAAVENQYYHEASASMQSDASALPEGVTSYSVGDFHLTWEKGSNTTRLTRATICPGAYGLLLRHGLLYRGVEGRR